MESLSLPPLTIAIPAYNRGTTLGKLLQSIAEQSGQEDDLVVVDDSSTDTTTKVVKTYPRFRLIRNPANLGMVGNWNACLHAAKHEWICIIHHDDEVAPGALQVLRRAAILSNGPALIAHQREGAAMDDRFRYRWCEPGPWAVLRAPTIPSGVMVHRRIVEEVGGFDPRWDYSSDLEYFPRICTRFPMLVVESPDVVRYQLHENNHQYATWRKANFEEQLEAIQRTIIHYAGLQGALAERELESRLTGMWAYMFSQARHLGDPQLLRQISRRLASRDIAFKLRVLAMAGRIFGKLPKRRKASV